MYNKLELEVYRDDEKFFGMKVKLDASSKSYFSFAVIKDENLNHIDEVINVISDYIKINFKNLYKELPIVEVPTGELEENDSSTS